MKQNWCNIRASAGLLLVRGDDRPEFLLAHPGGPYWASRDAGAWSLIKGEYDPREEQPAAAARREFVEETGITPPALDAWFDLGTVTQKGGKVVHGFMARGDFDPENLDPNPFEMEWPPRSGKHQRFPEIDRVAWLESGDAKRAINPAQRAFIDRALDCLEKG